MMNQATKIVTTAGLSILVPLSMSPAAFANTTSPSDCNQPQITINALEENPKTGELTITHTNTTEAQQQETIDAILSDPNVVEASIGQPVHAISTPQSTFPAKKKTKKAKQKLIKKYAPIYDIMYPAGDTLSQTLSAPKTNGISYPGHDPLFENQWHLTSTNIPAANTISQGTNTIIAVLDSPINTSHPELASSVLAPIVITPAGNETPIDHGTHVAGVIASQKNGFGSEGVALPPQSFPCKF